MEAENIERLKYHLIVDGESKFFADSLEKAQALAVEHTKSHLSIKIETVTGVASSDTWLYDHNIGEWKHVSVASDAEEQPTRPAELR